MGLGQNVEDEMQGLGLGQALAWAQGPGHHFFRNIRAQTSPNFQLPASQPLEAVQLPTELQNGKRDAEEVWNLRMEPQETVVCTSDDKTLK